MQHSITTGTVGGTILALIIVSASTVVTTVIVAIIGATTSFFVSLFLKWCLVEYKKWRRKDDTHIKEQ
jgi:phosphate/sulfate permease